MKKLMLVSILLMFFTAASLSAWEPMDLTRYPKCTTPGDFTLNLGVGLPHGDLLFPPVRLSGDFNTPMGDKGLPFFVGFLATYSGWEGSYWDPQDWWDGIYWHGKTKHYYVSNITFGGRFGYHFNWGVDNLDTYAVTTAGLTASFVESKYRRYLGRRFTDFTDYFWGIDIGARWWVSKGFGFWVETGYNPFSWFEIGLAFKF